MDILDSLLGKSKQAIEIKGSYAKMIISSNEPGRGVFGDVPQHMRSSSMISGLGSSFKKDSPDHWATQGSAMANHDPIKTIDRLIK